uniref:Uncharacterized protein n=1 Tax=Nelumbo nucifera TaxID=4432 RepID=A0A822ZEL0_NELNU|nr:TPA_asm: hypothetical protein HUJ06_001180 [Nelumbo nucifera]
MPEFVGVWMTKLVSKVGEKVRPQKGPRSLVVEQEAKPNSSASSSSSFFGSLSRPVRSEPAFQGTALSEATVRMLMDRFMPC